jgi:hypothetical protein
MATINAVNTSLSGQSGSGAFAGTTNPLFTNPRANAIYDINNLEVLGFTGTAGSVNYWNMTNNSAGLNPILSVAGSDTNIGMTILGKGTGAFTFQTTSSTPIGIYSGTAYQHLTAFVMANTAALQTVTFPDATGTLLMTGVAINSVPSIAFSSTSGIIGTTTNNNAAAGSVGEVITSGAVGPVALTTGVTRDVTSISLTAGDWDVYGAVWYSPTGNPTLYLGGSSLVSATQPGLDAMFVLQGFITANTQSIPIPGVRYSVASTTTVYVIAQANFDGTCGAYANITARRRR